MEEIKDLTLEKVISRLELLDKVISHQFQEVDIDNPTKVNPQFFTSGEKTCINQERRSLREVKEYFNGNLDKSQIRFYKVSDLIEKKINSCLEHIEKTAWKHNINNIEIN
jgi:hypothetical protein